MGESSTQADKMYEATQKENSTRKNTAATSVGAKAPYCVDGAVLYCTMGSASSRLRVEDHGLRITNVPAAHDGDTAPNKNIFPFGNCKLKKNDPCASPAPVGRWLLLDEYAVIGSCYMAKTENFQKAVVLIQAVIKTLQPFFVSSVRLPRLQMIKMEPGLRNEIYRAQRALDYGKERLAMLGVRTFTDTAEMAEYLSLMHSCAQSAKEAMNTICAVFSKQVEYKQTLQKIYAEMKDPLSVKIVDSLLLGSQGDFIAGLHKDDKEKYTQFFQSAGEQANQALLTIQSCIDEANAFAEQSSEDQGCQLTINSMIPCQVGGLIHF